MITTTPRAPRTRALRTARATAVSTAAQAAHAAFVERIRARAAAFADEPIEMSDATVRRVASLLAA